jgi:hypothetical protein
LRADFDSLERDTQAVERNNQLTDGGSALKEHIYEISIAEHLSTGWSSWLGEMQIRQEGDRTVLYGPLVDQAALHGVLLKIRDLGLTLISVNQLPEE